MKEKYLQDVSFTVGKYCKNRFISLNLDQLPISPHQPCSTVYQFIPTSQFEFPLVLCYHDLHHHHHHHHLTASDTVCSWVLPLLFSHSPWPSRLTWEGSLCLGTALMCLWKQKKTSTFKACMFKSHSKWAVCDTMLLENWWIDHSDWSLLLLTRSISSLLSFFTIQPSCILLISPSTQLLNMESSASLELWR